MNGDQQLIGSALRAWKQNVDRVDALFAPLTDEQLEQEIAPGRNRLVYLLGHLTAVHDAMLPLLGVGPRLHPELEGPYIKSADRSVALPLAGAALKPLWTKVNDALWQGISGWSPADWLARHTSISEEDFAREPHRNRFSVLLSRTSHLASHQGQIVLAVPRS